MFEIIAIFATIGAVGIGVTLAVSGNLRSGQVTDSNGSVYRVGLPNEQEYVLIKQGRIPEAKPAESTDTGSLRSDAQ